MLRNDPNWHQIRSYLWYGVASVSTIIKNISLFCKRALSKRCYSAKKTYSLINPTDRSHPTCIWYKTHYKALLQKRPIMESIWLTVATPYVSVTRPTSMSTLIRFLHVKQIKWKTHVHFDSNFLHLRDSNQTIDLWYGVAIISRHLKIIGLFCRI